MVTLCCIDGCFSRSKTKYHQELENIIEEADTYIRFYSILADMLVIMNKYDSVVISPAIVMATCASAVAGCIYITCPVDLVKRNSEAR